MLRPLAEGVWEVDRPIKARGFLPLPHRMTVLRFGRDVMLHSPVPFEPGLGATLAAAGEVRWIVAPSLMHDLFLEDWTAAFPRARLLVCPQWSQQRPSHPQGEPLPGAELPRGVLAVHIDGMPGIHECVLLHEPSGTLVVADLLFNIQRSDSALARLNFRVFGTWKRTAASRLFRAYIKDRAAFQQSMRQVLALPFDRVLVGHGDVVERDGRAALARAWGL